MWEEIRNFLYTKVKGKASQVTIRNGSHLAENTEETHKVKLTWQARL